MSHIHIPDGVLPSWLWMSGWIAVLMTLAVISRPASRTDVRRRVPLLAVVASVMLVAMSTEIVPIAYHINLTVIGGILLGPWLSPVAAFIVVLILAMLGHGGVTVVGLNTLLIGAEMVLGYLLFHGLVRLSGRTHAAASGAAATVITLAITTSMLVGIVWLADARGFAEPESGALDPSTLRFENPFEAGVLSAGLFSGDDEQTEAAQQVQDAEGAAASEPVELAVGRFAAIVFVLGPIGWALEAFVTALIVGYLARMRPSLLWEGAEGPRAPRLVGDEAGGH